MAENNSSRDEAPPSLKNAEWLKRPETARVFAALSGDGIETRAVGGAVRNTLLGLPVTEVDLACTAVPEKVMARARKAGLKEKKISDIGRYHRLNLMRPEGLS